MSLSSLCTLLRDKKTEARRSRHPEAVAECWAFSAESCYQKTEDGAGDSSVSSSQHQHFLFLNWHCKTPHSRPCHMINVHLAVASDDCECFPISKKGFNYAFFFIHHITCLYYWAFTLASTTTSVKIKRERKSTIEGERRRNGGVRRKRANGRHPTGSASRAGCQCLAHTLTHTQFISARLSPSRKPSYTPQGGPHPPCINILYVPKSTSKP